MEMEYEKILTGARKIINMLLNVQPEETVLIITDPKTSIRIGQALYQAAEEAKADPNLLMIDVTAAAADNPSDLVIAALNAADAIITPTSRCLFYWTAMINACTKNGARLVTLTECDEKTLCQGAIEADFTKIKPIVDKLEEIFTNGKTIRFTTPGGTDITASIEGRRGFNCCGIAHKPGDMMGASDSEIAIAPIEGTANGEFVCDASGSVIGIVEEPVHFKIKDGMCVEISGGRQAEQLKAMLEEVGDPRCYNLAEIALGMNPCASITGKIIEDEATLGTGHCAIGNSAGLYGDTWAPTHLDFVQWKPTLYIDDILITKDGELQIQV